MSSKISFVKKKVKINDKKPHILYFKRSCNPIYRQQTILAQWASNYKFSWRITGIGFKNLIAKKTGPGFVKRSSFRGNPG
jgi:hypothetical protein